MTCHDCVWSVFFFAPQLAVDQASIWLKWIQYDTKQIFDQRKQMEADWVWFWTGPVNRWLCLFLHEIFGTGQPAEPDPGLHSGHLWTTLEKFRRSLDYLDHLLVTTGQVMVQNIGFPKIT